MNPVSCNTDYEMAKFAAILLIVGVVTTVQALPSTSFDDLVAAARQNQWDQVQELLRSNFGTQGDFKPSFEGVRNLKPVDGGHVYGEAEYAFHSASNVDGKTTEDHTGHKVVNNDGKVKEFDFTPKAELPSIHPILPQSHFGNAQSASDNFFQFAPSSASHTAGTTPDKNVVNIGQHQIPNFPDSFPSFGFPKPGAQGGQNSHKSQYSYSHSQSFVNGKPVDLQASPFPGHKFISPLSFTDVRDLKPPQGGKVFGEAQYEYHSSSNVNGKVSEDQGGHKIINDNGRVQEFDFTPKPHKSPVVSYFT